MSFSELYVKGALVWVPDETAVWVCGVLNTDCPALPATLSITVDTQTHTVKVESEKDLPPLRNPDILIGENDLTSLSYLHEPAVLYNLQVRFSNRSTIYTYCGIVLVAINPYQECPIYGPDFIHAYRGQNMGDLDPHIFAVAEEAYTKMERENRDQSIIVSGESGAGKTVSAKYAMRYFASVGGSSDETQVEKKILASNPIMEAIGNAKTTRNDNSSRFGKYIELDFNSSYSIVGASMRTYLLEKSRVVFQAPGERNYHIFYQMCSSADDPRLAGLRLASQDSFSYLNQGDSAYITGVDDAADFQETCRAFALLGLQDAQLQPVFTVLAAVLHLGNVQLVETSSDSCEVPVDDPALPIVCSLLKVSEEELRKWLCHRKIVSAGEVIIKPINAEQATFYRDALSKHTYAQVFAWIVKQVNKCFTAAFKPFRFIGVLDIYGFETFEINSFEQFCINYANEKLQQQFNQHVFKLEQEEYVKEQIEWEFINFYDNQPCINLIESKLGILDLLDEECRMPRGSDQSWVEKLYDKCKASGHFSKPRLSRSSFIISHFADQVTYESCGFLEKNRDHVSEDHIHTLKSSRIPFVSELFSEAPSKPAGSTKMKIVPGKPSTSSSKSAKQSVGSQFRNSLALLMETLNSTTPHYVRCIKPNDDKEAFTFDPKRAIQQLRACGVLETVRISAAGYPSRWTYQEFFMRYRVLCHSRDIQRSDMRTTCQRIIANIISDEDKFKFGRSKIFFRAGQVAYMEKLRADRLRACYVMIQKHVKGFLQRNKYLALRRATLTLQRYTRGIIARKRVSELRRGAAAVVLQAWVRGWLQRTRYERLRWVVTRIQARARGKWARQRHHEAKRQRAAVVLQKHIRRYLQEQQYQRIRRGLITVQGLVKCFLARRQLKRLKIQAKSVEHQKQLNKGLENKIISLQQKLSEMKVENQNVRKASEDAANLKVQLLALKGVESELKSSKTTISTLEERIKQLEEQLEVERGEKMDVLTEKERAEKANKELVEKLNAKNALLSEELAKAQASKRDDETEDQIKAKLKAEKEQMLLEHDQEKGAYQKLLAEKHALEAKSEALEAELARVKGPAALHKRTASSLSNVSDATTDIVLDASDVHSVATEDDVGYGSVRSRGSDHSESGLRQPLDGIEWGHPALQSTVVGRDVTLNGSLTPNRAERLQQSPSGHTLHSGDSKLSAQEVSLVLALQTRLREVNKLNESLSSRLHAVETAAPVDSPLVDSRQHAENMIRLQELEMQVAKLVRDNQNLRQAAASTAPPDHAVQETIRQFETLQDELERRREECVHLRTVLATRATELRTLSSQSYEANPDLLNEDGELAVAYQTQKQVNKQLTEELALARQRSRDNESGLRADVERLRKENERQQKLISSVLVQSVEGEGDAVNGSEPRLAAGASEVLLQSEVMRLTSENLELQTQLASLNDQLKRYKKALKSYARKLKEVTGVESSAEALEGALEEADAPATNTSYLPAIRKKERDYMGMMEYDKRDETAIIKMLIYDLKPRVAVTLLPGLPAYILFMCIRHTDHINDDDKVRSLLNHTMTGIKRVIKKRHQDLDSTVLWLSNTLRLLHNLKQYSGDKAFQQDNTPKQNEQSLKNFDLSEYRQVLSDMAVWIYNGVIKLMEESIQPLVVPSILELEAISGLSGSKPGPMRGRKSSSSEESPEEPQKALDLLLNELTVFYRTLAAFGTDPELISQVFRQIFYFICAGALNNLLLRKDMCHWSKGMQIRYNLSHLEQWTRDMRLPELCNTDALSPIIQAAQLLQARKTDDDVQSICDMCNKLTLPQVVKILNLYTPDDFEERLPASFIQKIQQRLLLRPNAEQEQNTLIMNTKFLYPVRFPFNPSSIRLEDIELPEVLNLTMLKKV